MRPAMPAVDIVAILETRRRVLMSPAPPIGKLRKCNKPPLPDPFSHESYSFFFYNSFSRNSSTQHENNVSQAATSRSKTVASPSTTAATQPRLGKDPTPVSSQPPPKVITSERTTGDSGQKRPVKKTKRFVTKWTAEMDKVLRRALAKHGWGCWTLIAQSGKLPPEYSRKMISNRAKSIGLTREMYDVPVHNDNKPAVSLAVASNIPPS